MHESYFSGLDAMIEHLSRVVPKMTIALPGTNAPSKRCRRQFNPSAKQRIALTLRERPAPARQI